MSDTVIRVENLSKKYMLGTIGTGTLSKDLNMWWHKKRGLSNPYSKVDENGEFGDKSEHWALKDVSFDIEQGDAVGIIGKNGAGKSTLLKILSRITTPTTGTVKVKGRIASLLEVGTGFNGELSGRENIYLNGAILGMNKAYINSKLDEIIAFSGVEKYIDTPVKRYSSGMYVRLAFAVAAHLEPEILIVDEVLAVGDAEFQKKCLGKMNDVSQKEGRTVLFVSHNMQAISTLCTKGIFMVNGVADSIATASATVDKYAQSNQYIGDVSYPIVTDQIVIHQFLIKQEGRFLAEFNAGKAIEVFIDFELKENLSDFRIGFFIKNSSGDLLTRSLLADWNEKHTFLKKGRYTLKGIVPAYLLVAGSYILQVHTSRYGIRDYGTCDLSSTPIIVLPPNDYNTNYMGENIFGNIMIKQNWELENV